jgi:purine nucleosidase
MNTVGKKRALVFTDPGIDDAMAIIYLLNQPRVELIGVVAVAGNVPAARAESNTGFILDSVGADIPIYRTHHLEQPFADSSDYHGKDGLGGLGAGRTEAEAAPIELFTSGEHHDVLSLGPCTVVERFARANQFDALVQMGGLLGEGGNYRGLEYNFYLDTGSAARLLGEYKPKVVPLETCRIELELPEIEHGKALFRGLARSYSELARQRGSMPYYFDLVAAIAYAEPDRFEWRRCPVKVSEDILVETSVAYKMLS